MDFRAAMLLGREQWNHVVSIYSRLKTIATNNGLKSRFCLRKYKKACFEAFVSWVLMQIREVSILGQKIYQENTL